MTKTKTKSPIQYTTSSSSESISRDQNGTADSSPSSSSSPPPKRHPWLFLAMTRCPYPFLVILPFLFVMLICLGFSRPNVIEEDVSNLWIPSDGSYKKDKDYAERVGATGGDKMSSFAAMALSRHGDNLFKEENLDAIVDRMQLIEKTPLTYNEVNYTWDDVCSHNGLGSAGAYSMPCLRLSPMDLFQEARWYFTEDQRVTWYQEVRGAMMKPLVVRYGIMQDLCISPSENTACDHTYLLRTDPSYAIKHGYPANHAGSVTGLLKDLYSMQLNDPCRICIEAGIDEKLQELKDDHVVPAFLTLTQQLRRFLFALYEREDVRMETLKYVESLIKKTASIATKVSRVEVEDFYMYYTLRSLYAEGSPDYQEMYREVNDPTYRGFICDLDGVECPPEDVTLEEARETLLRHTDNVFSSHVTFGAPFPWWSTSDGLGHLFAGSSQVGGSGINMSAPLESLATYLDLENKESPDEWRPFFYDSQKEEGFVDPLGSNYLWETMVSTNPIYAWFMAGETEMTAHCGNGDLLGTNASDITVDLLTAELVKQYSPHLCTNYSIPFEDDATYTQQHFARMWYDLLIDSPFVLEITQGESDPYSWTLGAGCGYDLGYSRFSYAGQSEDTILQNASIDLYNIDEGAEIGAVDRSALIGDAYPPVGEYSLDNPLEHVGLLQSFYATQTSAAIVDRVKHQNRPNGPVNITQDDAREILAQFKIQFEDLWSQGWDEDGEGEVQFVGFFDDSEVPGTIGRVLHEVTMSSGLLTAISILVIAAFSVLFLASRNPIESRIGITLIGVLLVMLAFFASVGLGVLIGIKINLTIAWTLPFVILGLGVDNLYIILLSLQKQSDYSDKSFFRGMKEVIIPITMTSLVNLSMFAVMNINNIPAVYLTAQVAAFSIVFLYLAVVFCFPAYCYLDMQRQEAGRRDVFVWKKCENQDERQKEDCHYLERLLYDRCYQPLILGDSYVRVITHSLIWACAALLLALGLYGISISTVGLGLEDFLPSDHQGHVWASSQSEILGAWVIKMNWPELDYSSPDVQMKMIKQFENVVNTPHIVEIDTRMLWIAEMAHWTTRQCDYNLKIEAPEDRKCGRDQVYAADSICVGTWKRNTHGLREKYFSDDDDVCLPYDGGVCRPTSQMHPDDLVDLGIDSKNISAVDADASWCPVFEGWDDGKLTFCIRKWNEIMDGTGGLVADSEAECEGEFCEEYMVKIPIPYSSGPAMTAREVVSHELTLEMMHSTRAFCDDDRELHCWMSGAPFDYWSQYEGIQMNLVEISGAAVLIGFGISWVFLAGKLFMDRRHGALKVLSGSLVGAMLIAANCFFCLVAVVGISVLSGVSMTAFSIMSFVMAVGFAVEYSVHIVARWLRSDRGSAIDRVDETMSFLMLPTFMSFVSSTLGVICLAFTDFEFNTRFFFRPLITVMFVTYFFGCYWLPVFLTWFEFDFVKLGPKEVVLEKLTRSGSPPCKMQESESSEIEDTTENFLNANSSDTEANVVSMATCSIPTAGNDNDALEFLPCYAMANCVADDRIDNETSAAPAESEDTPLTTWRPDMPATDNPLPAISEAYSSETLGSLASNYTAHRSILSVASQNTVPVNNTRAAVMRKRGGDPVLGVLSERSGTQEGREACGDVGRSLVDAVSAESLYAGSIADLAAASSAESSNVFDGVDTMASHDIVDEPVVASRSTQLRKGSPGPLTISPQDATANDAPDAPRSTGSIAQHSVANSEFFDDGHPPIRQTLSSPKKTKSPMKPTSGFMSANGSSISTTDLLNTSSDFLLNTQQQQHTAGYAGYNFATVMDESVPPPDFDRDEKPRSNREIVTNESGEVVSVHTVFEDESGQDTDTIKF